MRLIETLWNKSILAKEIIKYCQLIILLNPTIPAQCLATNPEYKGDGYCEDDLNNENCEYDGGDCCLENVNTEFCIDCECKEPTVDGK